jgi:hypothetical protein
VNSGVSKRPLCNAWCKPRELQIFLHWRSASLVVDHVIVSTCSFDNGDVARTASTSGARQRGGSAAYGHQRPIPERPKLVL